METVQSLQAKGICPSCYNEEHGGIYPSFADRLIYEDDLLWCFFEIKPRAVGHTILLVKTHYEDMACVPDEVCAAVYLTAKRVMNALKEVFGAEKVYVCTMCDGAVNHFHIQLLPRYAGENIGSKNFVKPRGAYAANEKKLEEMRRILRHVSD